MLNKGATHRKMPRKVLITGALGRIGRCLMAELGGEFDLCGFDHVPISGGDGVGNDLSDFAALLHAMQGVETVIHLAATKKEAPFIENLVPNNIIGTYNVFEAARQAGVSRLVFASSSQSVGAYPAGQCVSIENAVRPSSLYGMTKVMGEVLGRYYFDHFGIEFVGLRIGWFLAPDDEILRRDGEGRRIWISPADTVRLFRCALEKPSVAYALVFGTSKTACERLSLREAHDLLGYEPQDELRPLPGGMEAAGPLPTFNEA